MPTSGKRSGVRVLCVLLLAAALGGAHATLGMDISIYQGAVGSSTWGCIVNSGYSFALVQAIDGGKYNDALAGNVASAWDAGMAHVDIYAFLCPNCQSDDPATQVRNLMNWVSGQGVQFGMLWFDIEQCDGCWDDAATNSNFIQAAVNEAVALGLHVGIYSSHYEWGLVCGSWSGLSSFPCWYADYDGEQNFDDFESYGGWTQPNVKQFNGDQTVCGLDMDLNWYPDGQSNWRWSKANATEA